MKKLTILLLTVFVSCTQENQPSSPNFLFILADDFGRHDMSSMGSAYYETPNLDRIASQSMVFTAGYATCQVCSPSRASIMSGKFPARHGITDYIGAPSGEDWRRTERHTKLLPAEYVRQLDTAYTTLPEALKAAGYKTFFSGKWHLGPEGSWPTDHGFDINIGGWDAGWPRGGFFSPYDNPNLENHEDGENLSMRLARETASFIETHTVENSDHPFFAYLSFYAVHSPIQTTQVKWEKYRDKADSLGIAETGFQMGTFLPIRQVQDNPVYAGLVEQMDDAVGLVLNKLTELGLEENTVVIFTSDNGGVAAGDAFATSNKPLRAGKGYQFEGGIREPYLINVPWLNLSGKTSDVPVTGTDFYPTILELAGLPLMPEAHVDGVSLLPILTGEGEIPKRSLYWHYPHYGNQGGEPSSIILKGEWKLIHYYEDGRNELYNLANDITESSDVVEDFPEIEKMLYAELDSFLRKTGARYPVKDPQYDPEKEAAHLEWVATEKLRQLEGYRMRLLSEDFEPGNNWWGSAVED